MNFSDFGNKLCSKSGILQLMDDIGRPLPEGVKPYRLGGGNPAMIPEISAMYRNQMQKIMDSGDEFEKLIGLYDSPQGRMSFIETVAAYLSKTYGWNISAENVAITNGSQSACFYLFNLLAGTFSDGKKATKKKIIFPLAPEYIGYSDQGIEEDTFVSIPSTWKEDDDHTFKYHVNFDLLEDYMQKNSDIGALCVTRPTNPTGNVLTDEEIEKLSAISKKYSIPLVIDNAYGLPWPNIIFTQDATPYYDENVILSMSLSKIGLPSLRTGIIIAPKQIVTALGNLNAIASLASGSFGQALAEDLIKNGTLVEKAREYVRPYYEKKSKKALESFNKYFDKTAYSVHKSEGSIFQWLWMKDLKIPTIEFYSELKKKGVIVVPGEYFFFGNDTRYLPLIQDHPHYNKCLRINYGGDESEVDEGIKIISETYKQFM